MVAAPLCPSFYEILMFLKKKNTKLKQRKWPSKFKPRTFFLSGSPPQTWLPARWFWRHLNKCLHLCNKNLPLNVLSLQSIPGYLRIGKDCYNIWGGGNKNANLMRFIGIQRGPVALCKMSSTPHQRRSSEYDLKISSLVLKAFYLVYQSRCFSWTNGGKHWSKRIDVYERKICLSLKVVKVKVEVEVWLAASN